MSWKNDVNEAIYARILEEDIWTEIVSNWECSRGYRQRQSVISEFYSNYDKGKYLSKRTGVKKTKKELEGWYLWSDRSKQP